METVIQPRDERTQPARIVAGYPQTPLRNPKQPLVGRIPTLSELTGPLEGSQRVRLLGGDIAGYGERRARCRGAREAGRAARAAGRRAVQRAGLRAPDRAAGAHCDSGASMKRAALVPTGEATIGPFFPPRYVDEGANDLTLFDGHRAR